MTTRPASAWRLLHAAVVLALAALLSITSAPHACAAGAPSPGSLSDIETSAGLVRAVLTVPATADTVTIDPRTISAMLAGKPARVAVESLQREPRSTMLLIDTSGSMGKDGISAATAAASTFLKQAPSDLKVGLATFADKPAVLVPPTTDRARVQRALPSLRPRGETALYDALQLAAKALGTKGSRTIMVLSDGADTVSAATLPVALKVLTVSGVRAEAVAFRTTDSQFAALQSITKATQGRLVQADDDAALKQAFGSAAKALAGQVRLRITVPQGLAGTKVLVVTGKANGAPLRAQVSAAVRPAAAPPAPAVTSKPTPVVAVPVPQLAAAPRLTSGWIWAGAGAVFAGVLLLSLFLAAPLFTPAGRRRIQALDQYIGTAAGAKARETTTSGASGLTAWVLRLSSAWVRRRDSSTQTALMLERADLPFRVNEWYVLRASAVVVTLAGTWLMWGGSAIGTVLGVGSGLGLGLGAPAMFLKIKASRRARAFETQLPDVLTLVASSLSTGFSLMQAIDAITRDAEEPSAKEFSRALAETRIGAELEDSLERLATRMGSINLEWATMAIRIQRQVGGNLAETLRTTATTLRDREALHRQVRALSAEGRLSAYILTALPLGLFAFMLVGNRDYVSLLWTRGLGLAMLAAGTVSLVVGIFWMRKVVEVEV